MANSTTVRVTTGQTIPFQRSDSPTTGGSAIVTGMTTEPASRAVLADVGELEQHRAALARHCRRMLGSSAEADDAVQETMIRAWRARDQFQDGSSLRTWLYHIATNVCFDALRRRRRHAVAVDLGPGSTHSAVRVAASGDGPAELAERSDNVRLAFVIALRRLPPTQRVAVILHDVFRWKADEVAALLDTTAPAVNSALQRARATLRAGDLAAPVAVDGEQRRHLDRLVDAFARRDVGRLLTLVRDDAVAAA
jgi:RNA polymerase sigma-70 factor (ECF subfamily)